MYFNISDIKTYNIDESYKQCFSNIKNSVEYSLAIDYMLERFDKNIVKEICLFLYKFKFATKKQIINVISKKYNISIDFNFQELVDFDFFKDFILVKGFVDEEYERNEEKCTNSSLFVHNYCEWDRQNAQKVVRLKNNAMESAVRQYNFVEENGCILLQNDTS